MSNIGKLTLCTAIACLTLCSCSNQNSTDSSKTDARQLIKSELTAVSDLSGEQLSSDAAESFFELIDDESISRETASKSGCVFYTESETDNIWAWEDFCEAVALDSSGSVCVCTENLAIYIDYTPSTDSDSAFFTVYEKSVGGEADSFTLSGCGISPQLDGGKTVYYIGDLPILTVSSANTDSRFVPFESKLYRADSGANLSFPYSRIFSSYSDFESYYADYGDELSLPDMQSDMKAYDDEGGFNAHVVFLYGDMEGSDSVAYTVTGVSAGSNGLEIYLKKTVPTEKSGQVGKWQVVVKVPGEYLDSVNPDSIHWITYEQEPLA